MSVNVVNSDGSLLRVAGGTLYADAPIGAIIPYGGATAPSGWLLCQGQAISRTDYSDLFNAIGIVFGSGDGSTSFNLPDLRETVPVGAGRMTGRDVGAHDVYTVGGFKDDQLQGHWHGDGSTSICNAESRVGKGFVNIFDNEWTNKTTDFTKNTASDGAHGTPRIGDTTHGKQLGVNYIIKAKMVAVPADFIDAIDEVTSSVELATLSSGNESVTLGDYICSKNVRNVCVMIKGHTSSVVQSTTKLFSGFFSPLTPSNYLYLDIPFAIRNRTTNVTEFRMGYLNKNGDFYTSAYTEAIESDWDIQLLFNYQAD